MGGTKRNLRSRLTGGAGVCAYAATAAPNKPTAIVIVDITFLSFCKTHGQHESGRRNQKFGADRLIGARRIDR